MTTQQIWSDLLAAKCGWRGSEEQGQVTSRIGALMDRLPDDVWSEQGLTGKYAFARRIAASAMAIVVEARHLELDEKVAIKFLAPDAMRSPTAISRFRREAKAAARIKNDHVVRIIDVASSPAGIPYIVMEYLDGDDLEKYLSRYPNRQAPIADAVDFVLQASEAFVEGHSLGIVHRDLKPANLFCIDRGDGFPMIKVLDFGISKFPAITGEVDCTDRYEILGSPRYMSPEQIDSATSVDHRTDIWSLGVILYELLSGVAPFNDDLIPDLWRKIRREAPRPLPTIRNDCSTPLWDVVERCLRKNPDERFSNLGEFAKALSVFAPERSKGAIARICWTADVSSTCPTRASLFSDSFDRVMTNPRYARRRWVIAGGVASVLAIGLSLVAHRRPAVAHNALATPSTYSAQPQGVGQAARPPPAETHEPSIRLIATDSSAANSKEAPRGTPSTKGTRTGRTKNPEPSASPAPSSSSSAARMSLEDSNTSGHDQSPTAINTSQYPMPIVEIRK